MREASQPKPIIGEQMFSNIRFFHILYTISEWNKLNLHVHKAKSLFYLLKMLS